ncbi:MAG: hypothetical protein J7K23_02560 [Thermoproteales archaeon]|nr:hypothetical protein [Thermoproteales archaeon]
MGKYDKLGDILRKKDSDIFTISFKEIEKRLGFTLPKSAYRHRAWWANDMTHSQARAWLNVGWFVKSVDLKKGLVTFKRYGNRTKADREKPSYEKFEEFAREIMSRVFGCELLPRKKSDWPKLFDFVSDDFRIVGDAKFFSMVRGSKIPPAKFSTISEHVWFLEKINADKKFLVFGKDIRVPMEWLKRYGRFVDDVNFYFIMKDGEIKKLL